MRLRLECQKLHKYDLTSKFCHPHYQSLMINNQDWQKQIPGESGVEAEVGDSGEDHDEESPDRSDRT